MITYKTIVNACNAFADNHHIIKGFGAGELWQINDHDQDSAFEYPLQYMVDVPSSPGPKSWTYAFRVYFVSRVEAPKDRDGNPIYFEYTSEKSAMLSCAQDFLSYWVQDVNYKLTIEQSLGVTTFIDAQEDGVTGCYVDIRFVVPFGYDSCIIPMDGVADPPSLNVEVYVNDVLRYTLTPGSELLLNVIDTNGDPVDATISGSNIVVPASAACDPVTMTYNGAAITSTPAGDNKNIFSKDTAGNNVGTKTVDTAGELTTVIADHQTELNGTTLTANKAETDKVILIEHENGDPVVITPVVNTETEFGGTIPNVVVPINTASLYKTGQTAIHGANDDGSLQRGNGVNFTTLSHNNFYGNTNRFTDDLGGQTYASGWIIDWATWNQVTGDVLWWYNVLPGTGENWTDLMNLQPLTLGGKADCYIPNENEIQSIFNRGQANAINYAPFNISVTVSSGRLWTSTTVASNTLNAYAFVGTTNADVTASVTKTTVLKYIVMRVGNTSEL